MPLPRLSPERGRTFSASLHYRNARQHRKFKRKKPRPRMSPERGHTFCASLRSRNTCQDFTRATSYGNLKENCRAPKPRRRLCASLHSRNACQDFTRVRRKLLREKMPAPRVSTLIKHRPLYYRKNNSVWTHCLGNYESGG